MAVEEDCPVCNASQSAKERFAIVKVAQHIKKKARRDETHRQWLDRHTENGTVTEIRAALQAGESAPRESP